MSYIEGNLINGESIIHQSKLHWVVFLWPTICFFVGIALLSSVGIFFILIAVIMGVVSFINYKTSEFGITNKRVIVKVGFIRRNSLEVLLNKIEGIQVEQGILGRVLGFGSIVVSGTGGTKDPFHNIEAPFEFRKKAQEQIASVQG